MSRESYQNSTESTKLLTSSEELESELKKKQLTTKEIIFITFDDPNFSRASRYLNYYISFLIVFSTICLCLQSVHSLTDSDAEKAFWLIVEIFVCINFTIDYLVRFFTCPDKTEFLFHPLNIIDLVSILPLYISFAFSAVDIEGLGAVRVLRLVRIFRIFKVARSAEALQLVAVSFRRSGPGIFVLLFMLTLAVVFYSSFIYYAELTISELNEEGIWVYTSGSNAGEISPYQNIPASFWWAIVTMTTVGYGDAYPTSNAGKVVASLAMVSGILVLAFPINMLGVHFSETYQEFKEKKQEREKKRKENTASFFEGTIQEKKKKEDKLDDIRKRLSTLTARIEEINKEVSTITRVLSEEEFNETENES